MREFKVNISTQRQRAGKSVAMSKPVLLINSFQGKAEKGRVVS
jgi:hypothetical protein